MLEQHQCDNENNKNFFSLLVGLYPSLYSLIYSTQLWGIIFEHIQGYSRIQRRDCG